MPFSTHIKRKKGCCGWPCCCYCCQHLEGTRVARSALNGKQWQINENLLLMATNCCSSGLGPRGRESKHSAVLRLIAASFGWVLRQMWTTTTFGNQTPTFFGRRQETKKKHTDTQEKSGRESVNNRFCFSASPKSESKKMFQF